MGCFTASNFLSSCFSGERGKSRAGSCPVQTGFSVAANGGFTCAPVGAKGVRGFRAPPNSGSGLTEALCQSEQPADLRTETKASAPKEKTRFPLTGTLSARSRKQAWSGGLPLFGQGTSCGFQSPLRL